MVIQIETINQDYSFPSGLKQIDPEWCQISLLSDSSPPKFASRKPSGRTFPFASLNGRFVYLSRVSGKKRPL